MSWSTGLWGKVWAYITLVSQVSNRNSKLIGFSRLVYSAAVGGIFMSSAGGLPGTWCTRMVFHNIYCYNNSTKFLNPVDSRILILSSLFGDRFAFIWWVISFFMYFLKSSSCGCTLKHLLFHMNFLISINS